MDLYKKNYQNIQKNDEKQANHRNYLHDLTIFQFLNIMHNKTFQMRGHTLSSNNVKFFKI